MQSTRYTTARTILTVVGNLGWLVFAVGVIFAIEELTVDSLPSSAMLGVIVAVLGALQVAVCQMSIALLDMADDTRRALLLQRAMAEQAGVDVPAVFGDISHSKAARSNVTHYMGEEIEKIDHRHIWNDQIFLTLGKAKQAIRESKS